MSFIADNNLTADEYDEGIWHIKKYANGTYMARGTAECVPIGTGSQTGSIYYRADVKLADVPTLSIEPGETFIQNHGRDHWCGQVTASLDGGITAIIFRAIPNAYDATFYILHFGRWKE